MENAQRKDNHRDTDTDGRTNDEILEDNNKAR